MKLFKKNTILKVAAFVALFMTANASYAMVITGSGYISVSADCTYRWTVISYVDDNGHGYATYTVDGPCGHGSLTTHFKGTIPPGSEGNYISTEPADYDWQYQGIPALDYEAQQQILEGLTIAG